MKDFLGKEIQPGDYVVVPSRWGSYLEVHIGRIVGVNIDRKPIIRSVRYNKVGRQAILERPDRAVIIRKEDVPYNIRKLFELGWVGKLDNE